MTVPIAAWRDDPAVTKAMQLLAQCVARAADLATRYDDDQFSSDWVAQAAATTTIQQIDEAAGRLPDEFKAAMPDVPWAAIRGMRNRIAHDDEIVNMMTVWNTITSDIPALGALLDVGSWTQTDAAESGEAQ